VMMSDLKEDYTVTLEKGRARAKHTRRLSPLDTVRAYKRTGGQITTFVFQLPSVHRPLVCGRTGRFLPVIRRTSGADIELVDYEDNEDALYLHVFVEGICSVFLCVY